ncbi:fimbrial protein [Lelliottia sp. V106_10]|uniref:fimbrial protein n=1 Tax=Lelliottia TaxID=1330545 RepID=UPI00254BF58F|nr:MULTISPECIES: fimbrial protein [unclassified Lelliottia]MDK9357757.1 fimbrial protein [Lelliottia sp. V106_16]MDK9372751.1 fimbrial protein [Lelliottia sp. V106_10]MDK9599555.1 fimbrial protein [Lelliottia sp. V106_5]
MKGYLAAVVLPLILAGGAVHAAGTSIDVKGRVVANPCTVDTDSVKKNITVPSTQAHALIDPSSGGDWVNFSLDVNKCPVYLKTVTVTFTGPADKDDATTYQNTGDAKNVSLQLAASDINYGNGSTLQVNVDQSAHSATFPLAARMYSAKGGATQGSFGAVVNFDFTYQ